MDAVIDAVGKLLAKDPAVVAAEAAQQTAADLHEYTSQLQVELNRARKDLAACTDSEDQLRKAVQAVDEFVQNKEANAQSKIREMKDRKAQLLADIAQQRTHVETEARKRAEEMRQQIYEAALQPYRDGDAQQRAEAELHEYAVTLRTAAAEEAKSIAKEVQSKYRQEAWPRIMNWEHDRQNAANSVQSIEAKMKSTSIAIQDAQARLAAARAMSETRCRDADTVWSAVQHNRPVHRQIVDAILEPTAEPSVKDTRDLLKPSASEADTEQLSKLQSMVMSAWQRSSAYSPSEAIRFLQQLHSSLTSTPTLVSTYELELQRLQALEELRRNEAQLKSDSALLARTLQDRGTGKIGAVLAKQRVERLEARITQGKTQVRTSRFLLQRRAEQCGTELAMVSAESAAVPRNQMTSWTERKS